MVERKCLRCDVPLQQIAREELQLGKTSWLFGDLPNLLAGGLNVLIMSCPSCGELSFFQPTEQDNEPSDTFSKTCPHCGKKHHIADRRCPNCGYEYH